MGGEESKVGDRVAVEIGTYPAVERCVYVGTIKNGDKPELAVYTGTTVPGADGRTSFFILAISDIAATLGVGWSLDDAGEDDGERSVALNTPMAPGGYAALFGALYFARKGVWWPVHDHDADSCWCDSCVTTHE